MARLASGLAMPYSCPVARPQDRQAIGGRYEARTLLDRIAAFRELLGKYPESPVSRKAAAEIGLLYYQNDDYDRAIEAYKHVVTQYPGSEEARLAMRDLKSI